MFLLQFLAPILLVIFGRRLFWLLVGAVVVYLALYELPGVTGTSSSVVLTAVAILLGVMAAAIALKLENTRVFGGLLILLSSVGGGALWLLMNGTELVGVVISLALAIGGLLIQTKTWHRPENPPPPPPPQETPVERIIYVIIHGPSAD